MPERKAFNFFNSYYDMVADEDYEVQCDFLYNLVRFQLGGVEPEFKTETARLLWKGHRFTIKRSYNEYVKKSGIPRPDWLTEGCTIHSTQQVQEQVEEQEEEQEKVQEQLKRERGFPSLHYDNNSI